MNLFAAGFVLLFLLVSSCRHVTPHCPKGEGVLANQTKEFGLPDKTVVFTYDDGPEPSTKELGDFLYSNGIQATFFVLGSKARQYPGVLSRLKSQGHLIANHSLDHLNLTEIEDPVGQIKKTDKIITPYITGNIFLLRAPYGEITSGVARRLNEEGLSKYVGHIHWNLGDTVDGEGMADHECWRKGVSIEKCGKIHLEQIENKKSGVILMHDINENSIDLTKWLVDRLKDRDYKFIRLDAVPSIRRSLLKNRAKPGTVGGPPGCSDY